MRRTMQCSGISACIAASAEKSNGDRVVAGDLVVERFVGEAFFRSEV